MPNSADADIDRRVKVTDAGGNDVRPIERVSDLRAVPFVVLLGEPGIGKSTVLAREAANEGASVISVRELMTGTKAQRDATLFLDALDEYRTDGGAEDKVHTLANAIAGCDPPRWRLTCRSEDWRKAADTGPMSKITAGRGITVAQLLPLDLDEASAILTALGEVDPGYFLKNAEAYGATGFIENPLGLKLLQSAVADGGTWPANRFQLFASATQRLAFERSAVRGVIERHGVNEILDAAAEAFLLLLVSGARAIWRSNNEPPSVGDARAYVIGHDLQIDRSLLGDMLDTPLFRGEGETFEPMHRTIAEFLAGRALGAAVRGSPARAALPLARALALVTGNDRSPPTELRGLFAWFAAHLAVAGDAGAALGLIAADPVTVLSYGDAAVFETSARRALLNSLAQLDPYFRASEVGVTAVGGLAGEDLAADFNAILMDRADTTHRLITVFDALTVGRAVVSLRPLLRSVVLDASRPEWQRLRAIEAHLNGVGEPMRLRRELFDELAGEPASAAREAIRAQLAGQFAPGALTVTDVRSVLADYRRSAPSNMTVRLHSLRRRFVSEPMPELFDDPVASWLPASNDHDDDDDDDEISDVLDCALASAIRSVPELSASKLWRWVVNIRREPWSDLKRETGKALAAWLDEGLEHEVALFDEILADDVAGGPWVVSNKYISTTHRSPSGAVVHHLLRKAATDTLERERLLTVAVEIAMSARDATSYWAVYDEVSLTGNDALLNRLTVSTVDEWRRRRSDRAAESNAEEQRRRANAVEVLGPVLSDIAVGRYPNNLEWAAHLYFERGGSPDIQRIVNKADAATAAAIVAGWNHIAVEGLGGIDAAMLGVAGAEQGRHSVEAAAVAGIYRLMIDGKLSTSATDTPIEVALAVLKSSWIVNHDETRQKLDQWAVDRLNVEPAAGAARLVDYWSAAFGAGATELPDIWHFRVERSSSSALGLALDTMLATRPALAPSVLRSIVRASAKMLDKTRLIDMARAPIADSNVEGTSRNVWMLVAFVLDPVVNASLLVGEDGVDSIALLLDDMNSGLIRVLRGMPDVDQLPTRVLMIRTLGPRAVPSDEFARGGRMTKPLRLGETVSHAVNALAGDSRPEAGKALLALASNPDLVGWHLSIRHAQAQQGRLMRDQNFRHPRASTVRAALDCGPPVNASDLRAVVTSELNQLRAELRGTDTTPWKHYWNRDSDGRVAKPLIENECRDQLLERLRDRLKKYQIAAALPEARRGEATRADILLLTGAGRNLPVEAKRHFHSEIWIAAATQLQGYTAAAGADGLGVYLVFWFGNDAHPTPARADCGAGPMTATELEAMLIADLPADLKSSTDVIVFDVSDPSASVVKKPRRKRAAR